MINVLNGSDFYKVYVLKNGESLEYSYVKNEAQIYKLLFEPIYLQNVSVRSIIELVIKNPGLAMLFEHYSIKKIINKYTENNKFEKSSLCINENVSLPISHLEVVIAAHYNVCNNEYHQNEIGGFNVVSNYLKKDVVLKAGNKTRVLQKGERIWTSVENVQLSEIYDEPIYLNGVCQSKNNDLTSVYKNEFGPTFNVINITLGYLLNTVFYHISEMLEIIEEENIEAEDSLNNKDVDVYIPGVKNKEAKNKVYEMVYLYTKDLTFVDEKISERDVNDLIDSLIDSIDIVEFFNKVYKGKVLFPEKYVGVTAHEYRQFQFRPLQDLQKIVGKMNEENIDVINQFKNDNQKINRILSIASRLGIESHVEKYFNIVESN